MPLDHACNADKQKRFDPARLLSKPRN